jgi:RimJ/RimL family protein N-acetyltransferase
VGWYPERIEGQRAVYERWTHAAHGPTLQALNRDRAVTEHIGGELPAGQVDEVSRAIAAHWDAHGFGLWAVVVEGGCVGFCGAAHPGEHWPQEVQAATELGWRLARDAWGRGLTTYGARRALAVLEDDHRIISLIAPGNERSIAVARRLGMRARGEAVHQTRGTAVTIYELP